MATRLRPFRRQVLPLLGGALLLSACAPYRSFFRDERVRTVPEADYRQPLTRIELAYGEGYYLANSGRASGARYGSDRPYVLVDLGNPTPIVTWSNKPLDESVDPPFVPYAAHGEKASVGSRDGTAQWTVQLTVPVAFHLLWDAFTDNNPIVDTDYTFGFDLSGRVALRPLTEQRLGVYWGHISTHLGDEYVISGRQTSIPFPRVNVSSFPWRVNGSNRWYWKEEDTNHARSYFQVGGQLEGPCVICHGVGYYYTYSSETDGVPIPMIRPGLEVTGSADLRILANLFQVNTKSARANLEPSSLNVGVLIGRKRIFPYLPTTSADFGLAANGTLGYRFPAAAGAGVNYVELYVRGYRGPNPYGQLRNQAHFYLVSMGAKILH